MTLCLPVSHFLMAIVASLVIFASCISHIHGRPVEDIVGKIDSNIYSTTSDIMSGSSDDCTKNFAVLERALVETADNWFKLIQAFYPNEKYDTIYVKDVEYHFLGEYENDSEVVSGSWIWTDSAFYLIQPPSVLQYTSLLFSYTVDKVDNTPLLLYLPYQCRNRNLNITEVNNTCRLGSDSINPMLGVLTQRLNYYAKFNDPKRIVIEQESITAAICDHDLESDVYDNKGHITTFLCLFVSLPFFFLLLLIVVVRSLLSPIYKHIKSTKSHPNIAALALTGIYFSIFIFIMDCIALHKIVNNEHELGNHKHYYPTYFVIGLLVIDTVALVAVLYVYLYLLMAFCRGDRGIVMQAWLSCAFACMYCPIFGPIDLKQSDNQLLVNADGEETTGNSTSVSSLGETKIWLVLCGFIAPFVCLLSHSSFIVVAWISNPQHAWSSALLTLFSFLLFFFMFRQAYIFFQSFQDSVICKPLQPQPHDTESFTAKCKCCCYCIFGSWFKACFCNRRCNNCREQICCCCCQINNCCNRYNLLTLEVPDTNDTDSESDSDDKAPDKKKTDDKDGNSDFNFRAFFCTGFIIGILIAGIEALVTFSFIELPLSTDTAPSYILDTVQLAFIIFAALVAYKVIVLQKPTEKSILGKVKKIYNLLKPPEDKQATQTTEPTPNLAAEPADEPQQPRDIPIFTNENTDCM